MKKSTRRKYRKICRFVKFYYRFFLQVLVSILALVLLFFAIKNYLLINVKSYTMYDCLDTTCRVSVNCRGNAEKVALECTNIIREFDAKFAPDNKYSDIYKINSLASTSVSQDTIDVLDKCKEFYDVTNGRFDITCALVSDIWTKAMENEKLPSDDEIAQKNLLTDFNNIVCNRSNLTVTKLDATQHITFGAVAKGYISDKICDYLTAQKVHGAMINLGGNIYVQGKKSNNSLWEIGIADPDNPTDEENLLGELKITDKFIITSGDYERYAIIDGKRYHHILDAKTGYPVDNELCGITIISDNGFVGDALSTCAFILGYEDGKALCEKYGVSAIFVTKSNKVYYDKKLKYCFDMTNKHYTYIEY